MKPDVVFIIDHLDTGGAPVVVRDLCEALAPGANVTLIALSDRITHTLPSNVTVKRLPYTIDSWWAKQRRYTNHARKLDQLLALMNVGPNTLVIAHLHHAHQVVHRSRVAKTAWYCLHSDPKIGFLGNKRGLGRWRKRKNVYSLYQGKRLVAVSQGIIDSLEAAFGVKGGPGLAINNPINTDRIKELALEGCEDVTPPYLLFVGRLEQRSKRFDRLLEAYHDSGVSLPLVIIGVGAASSNIREKMQELNLQDSVFLLGHKENPYPYMRHASALLLSSDYEGFSLVIAEALACGTPVISTDCPSGPREILTGRLARWLIPLGDNAAYSQAIRDIIDEPPIISSDDTTHLRVGAVAQRYLALADTPRV